MEAVPLKDLLTAEVRRAALVAGDRRINFGKVDDPPSPPIFQNWPSSQFARYRAQIYPPAAPINALPFREVKWAKIEIADTASVFLPEDLPHIFTASTGLTRPRSRAAGGTGLVWSIVKGIMDQLNGKSDRHQPTRPGLDLHPLAKI